MKRRSFLKMLGVGSLGLVFPKTAIEKIGQAANWINQAPVKTVKSIYRFNSIGGFFIGAVYPGPSLRFDGSNLTITGEIKNGKKES